MYFSFYFSLLFLAFLNYVQANLPHYTYKPQCTLKLPITGSRRCTPRTYEGSTSSCVKNNVAPIWTAFDENGSLNLRIIPEYAKYLVQSNIKSIMVNRPLEGSYSLRIEDRKRQLKAWAREAKKYGLNLLAWVGDVCLDEVLKMTEYAKQVGACAVAAPPPNFYRPNMTSQGAEYMKIFSEKAGDMFAYYCDVQTIANLNIIKLVQETEGISNLGIITDLNTALMIKPLLNISNKRISILINGVYDIAAAYINCLDGSVNYLNSIVPNRTNELITLVKEGNYIKATNLQLYYNEITTRYYNVYNFDETDKLETFISAMYRHAFKLTSGLDIGVAQFPERKLTPEEEQMFEEILVERKIICENSKE